MASKATDFLITPRDLWKLLQLLFHMSILGWVKLLALIGAYFAARYFGVGFVDTIFAVFAVAVFAYNLDARIPIVSALIGLGFIVLILIIGPHTQALNETTWPEPIAVWVYYFLAIGVAKQMKDMFVARRGAGDGEEVEDDARPMLDEAYIEAAAMERREQGLEKAARPVPLAIAPARPHQRYQQISLDTSRAKRTLPRGLVETNDVIDLKHPKYIVRKEGLKVVFEPRKK